MLDTVNNECSTANCLAEVHAHSVKIFCFVLMAAAKEVLFPTRHINTLHFRRKHLLSRGMANFFWVNGSGSVSQCLLWLLILVCVFPLSNCFLIARPRVLVRLPNFSAASPCRPLSFGRSIGSTHKTQLRAFKRVELASLPMITPAEQELFDLLLRVVHDCNLNTTIRVAGGWVRDRMLRTANQKFDVDLALENMTGVQFVHHLKRWVRSNEEELPEVFQLSVIPQNVEKSKHLETVTGRFGKIEVDIVHLRSENYTSDSRVPTAQHGSPLVDALRRDLTINALFYNLHTRQVEDHTGRGLQDLRQGLVRTPLSPLVTLLDDPLRAFRAVRFASRFQFRIDPDLVQACQHPSVHARIALIISPERCAVEMRRMFAGHAAAHSLARLYQYGLLQCVIKIPPVILEPREKPSVKSPGKVVREYFPIAALTQKYLEQNLFPIGMSTFMIANYLRQAGSGPSVESLKIGNSADAVEKIASGVVTLGEFPRWKIFVESIRNHEDVWTEFMYACLLSALKDYKEAAFRMCVYDMRMSSTLSSNIRRITEGGTEFASILQLVIAQTEEKEAPTGYTNYVPHQDGAAAKATKELSKASALLLPNASERVDLLTHLLHLHQASRTDASADTDSTAGNISPAATTYPSATLHSASPAAVGTIATPPPKTGKVPMVLGVLNRCELGQVLRRAGEGYAYALYLAAAQLARDRIRRSIGDSIKINDPLAETELLNTIARDFTLFNRIKVDPDTSCDSTGDSTSDNTVDGEIDNESLLHPNATDFALISPHYATIYRTELQKVLQATEFVLNAVKSFQLDGVWHMEPIFKGRALLEMFPKLPQGPVIAEMLETQVAWMLENPEESMDSLEVYLRMMYAKYL